MTYLAIIHNTSLHQKRLVVLKTGNLLQIWNISSLLPSFAAMAMESISLKQVRFATNHNNIFPKNQWKHHPVIPATHTSRIMFHFGTIKNYKRTEISKVKSLLTYINTYIALHSYLAVHSYDMWLCCFLTLMGFLCFLLKTLDRFFLSFLEQPFGSSKSICSNLCTTNQTLYLTNYRCIVRLHGHGIEANC